MTLTRRNVLKRIPSTARCLSLGHTYCCYMDGDKRVTRTYENIFSDDPLCFTCDRELCSSYEKQTNHCEACVTEDVE